MTEITTGQDEGIFADLGLDQVSADPNDVPDGVFKAVVHEAKMFTHSEKKEGENKFFIITYRIVEPEPIKVMENGKEKLVVVKDCTVDEWKSANKGDDSKKKSFLKQRLVSLGLDEADIDAGRVFPRQLVGIACMITVKNKNGYTNINKVVKADDSKWDMGGPQSASQQLANQTTGATGQSNVVDF